MESSAKPNTVLLIGLAIISFIAFAMAFVGWHHHGFGVPDSAYLALKSVGEGVPYEAIGKEDNGDLRLELARWIGAGVEASAIFLVFYSLFQQHWIRLAARFKRGHIIVVGKSSFADKLSAMCKLPIVHLRSLEDNVYQKGALIRLPFSGFSAGTLLELSKHAAGIVIAPAKDADAIELALATQTLLGNRGVRITVRLRDYWLAQRLHSIPGAECLRAISEANLAARDVVGRYPPYLMANDYGHRRIHAALIGDHDHMEAVMAEIVLSARTSRFGRPAFSFICNKREAFEARLARRYPELEAEADLAFHPAGPLVNAHAFDLDVTQLDRIDPVTCVYSVFTDAADAMSNALAFKEQAKLSAGFQAPIFVLMAGRSLSKSKPGGFLEPLALIRFGGLDELTEASGLWAKQGLLAEQNFHSAYLKFADPASAASKAWDALEEEYRLSNRRAVAHINAKLFEAGFDLRSWMADHDIWKELPALAPGERLYRSPDERERLAVLEHDRWMADRRLSGWRYGATRDNPHKLHPDLKPFAELSEATQDYDRKFVDVLADILESKEGGISRREQ